MSETSLGPSLVLRLASSQAQLATTQARRIPACPAQGLHQPTQARPSPARPVLCIALPLPRGFLRAHDINRLDQLCCLQSNHRRWRARLGRGGQRAAFTIIMLPGIGWWYFCVCFCKVWTLSPKIARRRSFWFSFKASKKEHPRKGTLRMTRLGLSKGTGQR